MGKNIFVKIQAIVVTSLISAIAFVALPALSQETEGEGEKSILIESTISGDIDPSKAITVEDVTISLDELQLLLKPLIVEEIQVEAGAWLILLKNKVEEVSNTEIVINYQNEAIKQEQEGIKALEKAQTHLTEASTALANSSPGTPEYEEASKKEQEAKKNFQEARNIVREALEKNKDLLKNPELQKVLEEGKNEKDITNAQEILEEARKERDKLTAGSDQYKAANQKINALNQAFIDLETADKDLKGAVPDSPEYQEFSQRIDQSRAKVIKLTEDIIKSGLVQSKPEDETSVNFEKYQDELDDLTSNLDKETAEVVNQLNEWVKVQENFKNQLVRNVTELQGEKTGIIDRFNLVLDALEKKGGDTVSYRTYIKAVGGIDVDITDVQALEGVRVRFVTWLQSEEGGIRWGLNLAKFVTILIVSWLISLVIGGFLDRVLKKIPGLSTLFRNFIVVSLERGVFVIGILIALTSLGVSLGPLLALLGGISFVLGFALQSNLGNFASGIMLFINKPFDVGDEVKVAGYWAFVDSITLASTKLKAFNGSMITLPNNTVWGADIINYTTSDIRKQMFSIYIKFDQNMDQVYDMWMEITSSHPKILKDPAPGWFPWNSHFDYYIPVSLSAWTKTDDYWEVYVDLLKTLQKRIGELGIQLTAPVQDIRVQDFSSGKKDINDKTVEMLTEESTKKDN